MPITIITPVIKDSVLKLLCLNCETEQLSNADPSTLLQELDLSFETLHSVLSKDGMISLFFEWPLYPLLNNFKNLEARLDHIVVSRLVISMQAYFFVRKDRKYVKVNYREVIYIESVGNYVKIVMETGIVLIMATLKDLDRILPSDGFCRINRACIVALDRIICFSHDLVQLRGQEMSLSGQCRKKLECRVKIIPCEISAMTIPLAN